MSDRRAYRNSAEIYAKAKRARRRQHGAEVLAGIITLILLGLSFAASVAMPTALAAGAYWLLTGGPMFR